MAMEQDAPIVAAVDLGSNSFHLTLAKVQHNNLNIIGRLKEKVRLAEGLDEHNFLDEASQQRGLKCLQQFKQRLHNMPASKVRAVGTFTLRKAKNARDFILKAQEVLGYPIEVISGKEESRLIYEGVAHFQVSHQKQLVIDIGGGSTEFAIGEAFEPVLTDSLQMGCVSYTQRFFSDQVLSKYNFRKAIIAARLELLSIQDLYLREGWSIAIGTSGTIESILNICEKNNISSRKVTYECLQALKRRLIEMKHFSRIELEGLPENRREILPAGLAILIAAFKTLKLTTLQTSPAALREGILFELSGIEKVFDIRERAIKGMLNRYHVDLDQARRVNQTALILWDKVSQSWDIDSDYCRQMLSWSARCHEIGLCINFSKQQKHGQYLLLHSDLNGFSVQQKQVLALIVRSFRRKFPLQHFDAIDNPKLKTQLIKLARILRLAVLLNHRRRDIDSPKFDVQVKENTMRLIFKPDFLDKHCLLQADLEQEKNYLDQVGMPLTFD